MANGLRLRELIRLSGLLVAAYGGVAVSIIMLGFLYLNTDFYHLS